MQTWFKEQRYLTLISYYGESQLTFLLGRRNKPEVLILKVNACNQYNLDEDLDNYKILSPWDNQKNTPNNSPFSNKKQLVRLINSVDRGQTTKQNQKRNKIINSTQARFQTYYKMRNFRVQSQHEYNGVSTTEFTYPNSQSVNDQYDFPSIGIKQNTQTPILNYSRQDKQHTTMTKDKKIQYLNYLDQQKICNNNDKNSYNAFFTYVHNLENIQRLQDISKRTFNLMNKQTCKYSQGLNVFREESLSKQHTEQKRQFFCNTKANQTKDIYGFSQNYQDYTTRDIDINSQRSRTMKKLLKKNMNRLTNRNQKDQDQFINKWSNRLQQ